jgi:hypothetical protein
MMNCTIGSWGSIAPILPHSDGADYRSIMTLAVRSTSPATNLKK